MASRRVLLLLRAGWPLLFLIPLGALAGRFCWLDFADPVYHGLVWLHERFVLVILLLAAASIAAAFYRFVRLQTTLRTLIELGSEPPDRLLRIFAIEDSLFDTKLMVLYIEAANPFCFTSFSGPRVFISRGFETRLTDRELSLVARHELFHAMRRDPWRSLAWHLFFAALILPGFDAVEQALYQARERKIDAIVAKGDAATYETLLANCSPRRDKQFGTICTAAVGGGAMLRGQRNASADYLWLQAGPATVSGAVLVLLLFSHELFSSHLPYLLAHHC